MSEEVDCKCGICVGHSLHDVYNMLKNLQHRGQDAAGIASLTNKGIDVLRWEGGVSDFSLETASSLLDEGKMFIGEVRYSTNKGKSKKNLFDGALPRFLNGRVTKSYDFPYPHIIVRGATHAIVHNGNLEGVVPRGNDTDTDVMLKYYANQPLEKGIERVIETFPAAYAAAIMDINKEGVEVFKDRYGVRPLYLGKKDGRLIAASEDTPIREIGGIPIMKVNAGQSIKIKENGTSIESKQIRKGSIKQCFFERVYLGHRLSSFLGMTNIDTRIRIGNMLAKEFAPDIDIVTYIPEAPEEIARGYSQFRNLPMVKTFYKVRGKRAFLYGTDEERVDSIGKNLFVRDNINIKGARLGVCEDSIVRGNNGPNAIMKLREAGAEYIVLIVGTPPLGPVVEEHKHGCVYGVDMPPDDNFAIRRYSNIEEMAKCFNVDDIHFISNEGMAKAYRTSLDKMCTYCIGGKKLVKDSELVGLDKVVEEIYRTD